MSTHGQSGLGRWEHGAVADKVLRAGKAPLLEVLPEQTWTGLPGVFTGNKEDTGGGYDGEWTETN